MKERTTFLVLAINFIEINDVAFWTLSLAPLTYSTRFFFAVVVVVIYSCHYICVGDCVSFFASNIDTNFIEHHVME